MTGMATARPAAPVTCSRLHRSVLGWLLLIVVLAPAFGQDVVPRRPPSERQKIDFLIATVAGLHDAVFIRKGSATTHRRPLRLRLKWRLAGARVRTAEEFITCCATRSSLTGINSAIRFAHRSAVDAATRLRGQLAACAADQCKAIAMNPQRRSCLHAGFWRFGVS
jgi:hypothetical protein